MTLQRHDESSSPPFHAPDDRDPPGYTLFLETSASDSVLQAIGRQVETKLRDNYHYDYCRRLDQLAPLQLFRVTGDAASTYLKRCVALGQRAGDVKPTALHPASDWRRHFTGHPLDAIASSDERS